MVKPATFLKETELCAAFIGEVKEPWVAYSETAGWDILLVNTKDQRQIGIQAKLKLNAKVMAQAVEDHMALYDRPGPDYRAVLVPFEQQSDLVALAPYCGITVIAMRQPPTNKWTSYALFSPHLPEVRRPYGSGMEYEWFEQLPTTRCRLPEFVPEVNAGSSSPLQLTPWKIAAMKLSVLMEQTGYLTRADFKRLQVDIRRFIGYDDWIVPGNNGFVKGKHFPNFRAHHPKVYAEIEADPTKWQRSGTVAAPVLL